MNHLRARLMLLGWLTVVLGGLHFADHVVRGNIVLQHGLDPSWNHSGWPFLPSVTPFTFSLLGVALVLGVGLIGTSRGRLWARYWLVVSILLVALVAFVHFLGPEPELPRVIYATYAVVGKPSLGTLALVDLFGLLCVLIAVGINAVIVARESGRW